MDRIEAMKLYCLIIETGQLSLAADALNISKGTVSKQLSMLETYLGGRLLNRTTRKLAPTEIGIQFYERAKQIIELVDESECIVTGLTTEPKGTLKINAPMAFGTHHLGELFAQYQSKYPKVKINITLSDRQIDMVEEGYDLVLRIAILEDSSLISRRLAPCDIVLCASPDYLKKFGEPQSPEELIDHNCLAYSYATSTKNWLLGNKLGEQKQIAVSGGLEANNGYLLADAMKNGMGIALLPTFVVGGIIEKGQARIILSEWKPKPPDISLLYPSRKHLSAKVRAFVDMSVKYFNNKVI